MSLLYNLAKATIFIVPTIAILSVLLVVYDGVTVQTPTQEKFCQQNGFQKIDKYNSNCYNVMKNKIIIKKYDCIPNPEYKCYFVENQEKD